MITSAITPTDNPEVYEFCIDNSSKNLLETCPRSSAYYSLYRRERNVDKAALFFGKVIHKALEHRKHGHPDWVGRAIQTISKAYVAEPPSIEEWRTPDLAIKAILHYESEYPLACENIDYKPGTIEQSFKRRLGTIELDSTVKLFDANGVSSDHYIKQVEIYWTGRMDGIVDQNGVLFALDHKTSSIMGVSFWDQFLLSSQMIGYTWAGREIGYDLQGVIIDALGIRKPSKSGVGFEFARRQYYYSEEEIAEWKRDMFTSVVQFFEYLREDYYPKFTQWCHGKYSTCPYFDVCCAPPALRQGLLYGDGFREVTWSPLNED